MVTAAPALHNRIPRVEYPFHILIKPAGAACNLRCEYCFYLKKEELYPSESKTMMSIETLELLMEQIISSHPEGMKEIQIGWQGGEPTLCGLPFYEKAVEIQKRLAPRGTKIVNGFQTNGILINNDWARFFKKNNFLVGLSLDGPEKLHDRFRKDREGNGTHSRVINGLEYLKTHGVEFNTLTSVQSDNAEKPEEVYNFLKNSGSQFLQFIPIVEPMDDGTVSNRTVNSDQWGRFLSSVFDIWRKRDIGKIFIQHFDSVLGGYMGQPGGVCVSNKYCGRSLVAEHNGDIYSCDHYVFPETLLENISEINLAELINSPDQRKFGTDKFDNLPQACLQCAYLSLCFGGCPKNRINKTATGESELNWLCDGYMNFFKHSETIFKAMSEALKRRIPASEYFRCLPPPGRNDPCPCGSGKKYKQCHGR